MLRTRMFSEMPGRPGRRQQMPRITRSIGTPAWLARYRASIARWSTSELSLAKMRDGLPWRARSACSSISSIVRRLQIGRGDHQLLPLVLLRIAGQQVEQGRGVVGHRLVGGEQAEVGVDERGGRVVVAGAQVDVAADLLAFLAARPATACSAS